MENTEVEDEFLLVYDELNTELKMMINEAIRQAEENLGVTLDENQRLDCIEDLLSDIKIAFSKWRADLGENIKKIKKE